MITEGEIMAHILLIEQMLAEYCKFDNISINERLEKNRKHIKEIMSDE